MRLTALAFALHAIRAAAPVGAKHVEVDVAVAKVAEGAARAGKRTSIDAAERRMKAGIATTGNRDVVLERRPLARSASEILSRIRQKCLGLGLVGGDHCVADQSRLERRIESARSRNGAGRRALDRPPSIKRVPACRLLAATACRGICSAPLEQCAA